MYIEVCAVVNAQTHLLRELLQPDDKVILVLEELAFRGPIKRHYLPFMPLAEKNTPVQAVTAKTVVCLVGICTNFNQNISGRRLVRDN